jgi:DNA-binding NarL/FixJ family response regulator
MLGSKTSPPKEERAPSTLTKRVDAWVDDVRARAKLTQAQARVLRHLVVGDSNKDIAQALKSAPRTIEVHVADILAKVGAESRARLIAGFWMGVFEREER